ncbi:MAG: PspA/IM30 family protein [Rectinema subterraneum]|uniref:PspA/IM30 family protein n=1 Tax=Rectinema subterraneum TaxID=2653714 RepID=UPI003C7D3780
MTPQELSRLDYEGASEMLLACATDAKKYEKEIASLQAQAAEWKSKARLAQDRNMEELSQAALQKSAELEAKAQELALELNSIQRDIEDLRTALPIIKAKQRSVDPDQLLAELSMLVGLKKTAQTPESDTKPNQNPEEPTPGTRLGALQEGPPPVDDALAELKKKMGLL